MSHEIRTPLNGILGFSSLLNNEAISIEDRSYYIDIINQSSNQLLSIVDDILSLSKLETGQYEVLQEKVCINGLIDELVVRHTPKASEKGISLSSYFGLSSDKSIVLSDSSLLKQILENLISNAIKFTQNGHVLIGYTIENDFIQFYIEDSGIGIDKEFHSKIFDRFQQVDIESTRVYGGTGLGLTIAKGTCELLGGKIWLDSEQEHGSKFLFTIPYIPTQQSQLTQTITTKEDSMNPKTNVILIAEDEEINFLYLEESLRDFEYEIVRAHDGEEAVEICKNDERISLVLMDIKMPNMDGYTALKEIQKIRPELPIIAQTAYAMLSDKEMALEAGFKDYLAKPIKTADLFNTLNQYLTK